MIAKLFLNHPESVNESYLEHMRFALWFSGWFALAAGAALVHAIIPAAFEKTGSSIIAKLYQRTQKR
jgi:hypothetical protein